MAIYNLRVRRYQPEAVNADGEPKGTYWEDFEVDLEETLSVLDGLLHARSDEDGSLAVRCSCRAAICGSCGVKINGQSTLACKTQLQRGPGRGQPDAGTAPRAARRRADRRRADGEHAGDQGPGHGHGVHALDEDPPGHALAPARRAGEAELEREHVVPPESMIDITQTMACIQCGACVSSCLSMEADPEFIGPAALAKAYRFVGDPRDAQTRERLWDLSQDPHGIYDCTHCFACIDACPKGVAPMDQIMRLRRAAADERRASTTTTTATATSTPS